MAAADIQALRDVLLSICKKSGLDMLGQTATQDILNTILDEARRVLADVAYDWNVSHAIFRLPEELLAECFAFLPFPCRITASHVSRTWRVVSINTQSLWADITGLDGKLRLTAPLVQCAFSRAGSLPLHFEYYHELEADVSLLVHSAMHRMASLNIGEWKGGHRFLAQNAPILESLRLLHGAYLPEDFLAGAPGKLAVLDARYLRLAPSCPGLSNLSILRLADCKAQTIREMFRLCPRLRSLSVRSLAWTSRENIGDPPDSLEELSLASTQSRYNTTEIYEAFEDCPNLTQISLEQVVSSRGFEVGPVLHGVQELDIVCPPKEDDIMLCAHLVDGRRISLALYGMQRYTFSVFSHIFNAHNTDLGQLRMLRIPHFALEAFARKAGCLPDVEVRMDITDGLHFMAPREYSWDYLRPLTVLEPRKAVLVVAPHSAADGPSEDDARALVAELAKVPRTVQLTVHGFARDAVPEDLVQPPNVIFEYDVRAPL